MLQIILKSTKHKMTTSFHLFSHLVIFILFLTSSYSFDNKLGNYPVVFSSNFRSGYYSIKTHSRVDTDTVERVDVYDDFECIQQCSRLGYKCKSINYKTTTDDNGMHVCEMNLVKAVEDASNVGHSESFQHLALEVSLWLFGSYRSCESMFKLTRAF